MKSSLIVLEKLNVTSRNKDKISAGKTKLVELFNLHYINIVEKTSGITPEIEGNPKRKANVQLATQNVKLMLNLL